MNNTEKYSLKIFLKYSIIGLVIYVLFVCAFSYVGGQQIRIKEANQASFEPMGAIDSIDKGVSVDQTFVSNIDTINSISLLFGTYARTNNNDMLVSIKNEDGKIVYTTTFNASKVADNLYYNVLSTPLHNAKGAMYTLEITSNNTDPYNTITVYKNPSQNEFFPKLLISNKPEQETLCMKMNGINDIFFGKFYYPIMGTIGLFFYLYILWIWHCLRTGKNNKSATLILQYKQYKFLLDQLVSRDFKTRYKRSMLGILWSFLNPLLTMMVQYVIFSTLFKSNISHFPAYLLIGIVFFSFFQESTNNGLTSITGNAHLITKVYVPKYIFPISKVLSSLNNMYFSFMPLILVILFTGLKLKLSYLLLPFPIICTMIFCFGMSLILSTLMVFFRDTQFLWGVLSMLWMYLTPIFYPASIIPANLMPIYKLNPMFQFIRFTRSILIDGVSPEPRAYFVCILISLVSLCVGLFVFKKFEDKFILYM